MSVPNYTDNAPIPVVIDADLQDLIPGFMKRRREDVDKLVAAVERQDFKSVRLIGHSLKGNGGGYGFHDLSTIGAAIESAANGEDLDSARAAIEQFVDYLDRVRISFE